MAVRSPPPPLAVRGGPSSTRPVTLTKQSTASAAVAASAASASAPASPSPRCAGRRHVQQRLQGHPLGGKAVQRRQAGDRERADEERAAGPRQPPQQPAEPVEPERACRALERAGAEEEQRLEHRVIQRVQQRGGQRDRGPGVGASGAQDQACAEAEDDDPDVLDRVEREQPLQVVLEERVDDAADRRQRTERKHQHTDPDRQRRRASRRARARGRRSRS